MDDSAGLKDCSLERKQTGVEAVEVVGEKTEMNDAANGGFCEKLENKSEAGTAAAIEEVQNAGECRINSGDVTCSGEKNIMAAAEEDVVKRLKHLLEMNADDNEK